MLNQAMAIVCANTNVNPLLDVNMEKPSESLATIGTDKSRLLQLIRGMLKPTSYATVYF
jgi:hypothetical protein